MSYRALPELVLFVDNPLIVDLCDGTELGISYSAILVKSLITLYFINRTVERKDDFTIVL